jgi:hypothetical protein
MNWYLYQFYKLLLSNKAQTQIDKEKQEKIVKCSRNYRAFDIFERAWPDLKRTVMKSCENETWF